MIEPDDILHDGPNDEPDDIADEDADPAGPDHVEEPGEDATHGPIEPTGGLHGQHQDVDQVD